jgi:hypothetical protein
MSAHQSSPGARLSVIATAGKWPRVIWRSRADRLRPRPRHLPRRGHAAGVARSASGPVAGVEPYLRSRRAPWRGSSGTITGGAAGAGASGGPVRCRQRSAMEGRAQLPV